MKSREELISRAMEDPGFRARLTSDPRGTLERELGVPVPADTEITVLEQSRTHAYVVLPAQPELSEEELAGAAGGGDVFSALVGITYGKGC
jgi:hypothetical protein